MRVEGESLVNQTTKCRGNNSKNNNNRRPRCDNSKEREGKRDDKAHAT